MKQSTRRARIMRCTHRRRTFARWLWRWNAAPHGPLIPSTQERRRRQCRNAWIGRRRSALRIKHANMRNALKGT